MIANCDGGVDTINFAVGVLTFTTQLKQIPTPQAIGVSSETSQGTCAACAILATASIIGSGPQQTM